jgi:hypothetical protein
MLFEELVICTRRTQKRELVHIFEEWEMHGATTNSLKHRVRRERKRPKNALNISEKS